MAADDTPSGFAVAVVRDETAWVVSALSVGGAGSIADAGRELKNLRAPGAAFGILNVDDEFFILLRPGPSGTRLLLSDATAAVEYDVAVEVLEALNVDIPDLDPDELDDVDPWEEGDLAILSDLGLPDQELSVILSDYDLYADEQIAMIAQRLGFDEQLSKVLDKST